MGELGDLLELLHGAHRSFRTVRLEAREWRHTSRQQEAYERAMASAGGQVVHVTATRDLDGIPGEWEVRVRAWFEQPNRVREEREEAGRLSIGVAGTEEAERRGRPVRVSAGPWHRVLIEQDGTFVELDSGTVETDALVELALSLVPAAAEPPPLVP